MSEAIKLMSDKAIRRLPLVNGDGTLAGLVSLGDLAEQKDPESLLADISEAPANT